MYRPIDIQIQLTPDEARALWVLVKNTPSFEPLSAALQDSLEHCARWGTYPAPYRALVVGVKT